jgi:hypothetical protein
VIHLRHLDGRASPAFPNRSNVHVLALLPQCLAARCRLAARPLLANDVAAKRLITGGVDREVRGRANASDHAPVWIVLRAE